jgi:hypothetical protein
VPTVDTLTSTKNQAVFVEWRGVEVEEQADGGGGEGESAQGGGVVVRSEPGHKARYFPSRSQQLSVS